jgi:hypothetical protein
VGYLPLYSEYHVSLQSPDDTPRDLCAKLVFRAWGLSDEDCEIQLSEQRSVIDEYYERHGPIEDDPNYPFQVEVGRDAQGNSVTGHVTILRRTTEDI